MKCGTTYVLLVEDSDADAGTIQRLLNRAKSDTFNITRVGTLSAGLARLHQAQRPDVILLDLSLPDSHHSLSATSMLSHSPGIPVIVLTGNADEQAALEIVQQGVMDYLVKDDLNQQVLLRSIRYAIERLRILEELRDANRELAMVNADLEQRVSDRTKRIQEMEATARQQQQELAHADRLNLMGELASGLAHELNQPLMAIAAFSKSAQQRLATAASGNDAVNGLLRDVSSEANRAGEIIQRLRQMIQRREPRKVVVRLHTLIKGTLELVQADLKSKSIQICLPAARCDSEVRTDTVQLQQVILNLISNAARAVKVLPHDQHRVSIEATEQNGFAIVTVRNPNSEPVADPTEWFQPFFTTGSHGIGLGLPISRRIMTSLGGQLDATVEDHEVAMTLRLPLHSASADSRGASLG